MTARHRDDARGMVVVGRIVGGVAATVLAAGLLLLTSATPAFARQRWTSSFAPALPNPMVVESGSVTFAGSFTFDPTADRLISSTQEIDKINVTFTRVGPPKAGCDGAVYQHTQNVTNSWEGGPTPAQNRHVPFSFAFTPACNGTYDVRVGAVAAGFYIVIPTSEASPELAHAGVQVVAPPPAVSGLDAAVSGSDVNLSWSPPAAYAGGPPADFAGYVVERKVGADFQAVGSVDATTTQFADRGVLTTSVSQQYRVRAARQGAAADQLVLSGVGDSPTRSVSRAAPPNGSTSTTVGSPRTTVGSPTTAGGRGVRLTTGGRSATTARGSASLSSNRSGTRSTSPTTRRSGARPSINALPYSDDPLDDVEPGEPDPVLPDGQLASGPALRGATEEPGQLALLTPVAIGAVLLVWAAHLRFLSRQARAPALVVDEVREKD